MNDNRGSIWRKWDLHIHSPFTHLENRYAEQDRKPVMGSACSAMQGNLHERFRPLPVAGFVYLKAAAPLAAKFIWMKKFRASSLIFGLVLSGGLMVMPSVSYAASLTQPQISALISLLTAFDVPTATIDSISTILGGTSVSTTSTVTSSNAGSAAPVPSPLKITFESAKVSTVCDSTGEWGKCKEWRSETDFFYKTNEQAFSSVALSNGKTYDPPVQNGQSFHINMDDLESDVSYTYVIDAHTLSGDEASTTGQFQLSGDSTNVQLPSCPNGDLIDSAVPGDELAVFGYVCITPFGGEVSPVSRGA